MLYCTFQVLLVCDIDFYRSERFCARNDFNFSSCQLTEPPRFTVIRVPRSKCGAALTISYNRISERLESAKRLHRYLNFADDGNHARLDTSIARFVGFLRLGYFTIGSNPPRWSGSRPSRLLCWSQAADLLPIPFDPSFYRQIRNPYAYAIWMKFVVSPCIELVQYQYISL